jgi:hypothetical protein
MRFASQNHNSFMQARSSLLGTPRSLIGADDRFNSNSLCLTSGPKSAALLFGKHESFLNFGYSAVI